MVSRVCHIIKSLKQLKDTNLINTIYFCSHKYNYRYSIGNNIRIQPTIYINLRLEDATSSEM